jgi:hypothetical protein
MTTSGSPSTSIWLKGPRDVNWFVRYRQEWIGESLRVYGFINRDHLQRKFGIHQAQASKDLQTYLKHNPGALQYNPNTKRYEVP